MAPRKKAAKKKKKVTYKSAEQVSTGKGRQYHIGLAPGEVAPYILLCGDPARAGKVAQHFDKIRCERANREYVTYTGTYRGLEMSVMGTGIGPDNMEIAIVELSQIVQNPAFIRIGSCGALQPEIKLGELVVSTGSVRLENTSTYFVPEGYPAVAHHEIVLALISACEQSGVKSHVGLTATAPGFYGAQARKIPGFPPRFPDLPDHLREIGVKNLEMESSTLFTLAQVSGARAGMVCAVYANRPHNRFADSSKKDRGEKMAIQAGLAAFQQLARMDAWKKRYRKNHFHL
jgi:uridine phosphorylase